MRVLLVGSGGREHALVWKLAQSPLVSQLLVAPGNAGMGEHAACVPVAADDLEGLRDLALKERVDLTVVGPEIPLAMGIVDLFAEGGLRAFGPTRAAAQIEASKVFAKRLMRDTGIPTGDCSRHRRNTC